MYPTSQQAAEAFLAKWPQYLVKRLQTSTSGQQPLRGYHTLEELIHYAHDLHAEAQSEQAAVSGKVPSRIEFHRHQWLLPRLCSSSHFHMRISTRLAFADQPFPHTQQLCSEL